MLFNFCLIILRLFFLVHLYLVFKISRRALVLIFIHRAIKLDSNLISVTFWEEHSFTADYNWRTLLLLSLAVQADRLFLTLAVQANCLESNLLEHVRLLWFNYDKLHCFAEPNFLIWVDLELELGSCSVVINTNHSYIGDVSCWTQVLYIKLCCQFTVRRLDVNRAQVHLEHIRQMFLIKLEFDEVDHGGSSKRKRQRDRIPSRHHLSAKPWLEWIQVWASEKKRG